MQNNLLPAKILQHIDRIQHNILWGSSPEKHKLHLIISWDAVTTTKNHGGLGIPKIHPKNLALLTSLHWWFCLYLNATILRLKYHPRSSPIPFVSNSISRLSDSYIWKSMTKASPLYQKGTGWNIASGIHIQLWNEYWIAPNPSQRQIIQGPLPRHEPQLPLNHIIKIRTWNFSAFSFELPTLLLDLICNTI